MNPFCLTVPGNLLLAGEYAVTREGGLGITLATPHRMILKAAPHSSWEFQGLGPWGTNTWKPGASQENSVFSWVWEVLGMDRESSGINQGWKVVIDSRPFHFPDGRKMGLGSSAGAAALAAAALIHIRTGITSPQELAHRAFLPGVQAHRNFQGGKGSGYDLAASLFGRPGLFTGGQDPQWRPADFSFPGALTLLPGPAAVKTPGAVGGFTAWALNNPVLAQDYLEKNNSLVTRLVSGTIEPQVTLEALATLGRKMGKILGVPADLSREYLTNHGLGSTGWKALGAGNEVILAWEGTPEGTVFTPEKEGLKWE